MQLSFAWAMFIGQEVAFFGGVTLYPEFLRGHTVNELSLRFAYQLAELYVMLVCHTDTYTLSDLLGYLLSLHLFFFT